MVTSTRRSTSYAASYDAQEFTTRVPDDEVHAGPGDRMGKTFESLNLCLKRFPCHITAHMPVQAVLDSKAEHGFSGREVSAVTVRGSVVHVTLKDGRQLKRRADGFKGLPSDPVSRRELADTPLGPAAQSGTGGPPERTRTGGEGLADRCIERGTLPHFCTWSRPSELGDASVSCSRPCDGGAAIISISFPLSLVEFSRRRARSTAWTQSPIYSPQFTTT